MKWDLKNASMTKRFNQLQRERVHQYVLQAGIQVYSDISLSTPVDTGRARYSWYCSVKSINYTETPEGHYVFDPLRAAQEFSSSKPGDKLYISNSTPYIQYLNEGSSRQAPARFVESTVMKVKANVNKLMNKAISVTG